MNIRKKGKWGDGEPKFVIEEQGKYIETVPKVLELVKMLRLAKASCAPEESTKGEAPKDAQTFAQDLLNEPQKQDTKTKPIDVVEEFKRKQDEVLRGIL